MIDPVAFRDAILAATVLGGGAFTVEQYVRHRTWPQRKAKDADGGPCKG